MIRIRLSILLLASIAGSGLLGACSAGPGAADSPAAGARAGMPVDPAHEGISGPHGDHSPHHGGLVLMNDDLHYEVVFSRDGRHEVWFTDAMRNDLPASLASHVTLTVMRPGAPPETLALAIDDSGEAWVARGQPVEGEGVTVKITYAVMGESSEIEVPFVPATP